MRLANFTSALMTSLGLAKPAARTNSGANSARALAAICASILALGIFLAPTGAARAEQKDTDSTKIQRAGLLSDSYCPNLNVDPQTNVGTWYAPGQVPGGYYKSVADGNCHPIPGCPGGSAWTDPPQACTSICSAPQTWDPSTGSCVSPPPTSTTGTSGTSTGSGGSGGVVIIGSGTPACPGGTVWDAATSMCVSGGSLPPLYDCPASIFVWNDSNNQLPLLDGNPSQLTPDGHQWCYYWGMHDGDSWAAAFDRVKGQPVTYFPYYTESATGDYYRPSDYGSTDLSAYPIFSMGFAGLIPYYGPSADAVLTNGTLGGSKCAPLGSYMHAWYPSDCSGHGGSSLSGTPSTPQGGWCVLELSPSDPMRQATGIVRVQNGGGSMLGTPHMSVLVTLPDGFTASPWLGTSGGGGCTPGRTDPYYAPPFVQQTG